jgi:hypothetical protein
MSLGVALSRAIVVPVDILLTTGVLGHVSKWTLPFWRPWQKQLSYRESALLLTTSMLLSVGQIDNFLCHGLRPRP